MDNNSMLNKAKKLVVDYFNGRCDRTDNFKITEDQVFVVWFCKTLQNWKALVSTTVSDGMYYEVTYNGDKKEAYIDAYKKWENKCVPDGEENELGKILEEIRRENATLQALKRIPDEVN